jgi:hypothetical protein
MQAEIDEFAVHALNRLNSNNDNAKVCLFLAQKVTHWLCRPSDQP